MSSTSDTPNMDVLARRGSARKRFRFYSVMLGLGLFGAVFSILVLLPFKYEARVDVLVRIHRDSAPVPQMGGTSSDQIVVTGVRAEDVATEISLLTGRPVAEAVYESLGPDFFKDEDEPPTTFKERVVHVLKTTLNSVTASVEATLIRLRMARESTPREDAIADITKALDVSKSVRSDLISLGVRAGSPEKAEAILKAITSAYYDAHRSARAVFRGNDLFRDLQAKTETELADLGARIEQAKADLNVYNFPLWIEQRTMRIASLKAEQGDLARELATLERRREKQRANFAEISAAPLDAEALNNTELLASFRAELGRGTRELERNIVRHGRTAQQVQEARAVIDALHADIRAADLAETERLIRSIESEMDIVAVKAERITARLAELQAEVALVSGQEAGLRALETQRGALAASLAQVTEERTRSEWLAALDNNGPARIAILEPITVSQNPVAPNKVMILIAGLVVAILASLGLYIALSQMFLPPAPRKERAKPYILSEDNRAPMHTPPVKQVSP